VEGSKEVGYNPSTIRLVECILVYEVGIVFALLYICHCDGQDMAIIAWFGTPEVCRRE
jgi:hypothetical protein